MQGKNRSTSALFSDLRSRFDSAQLQIDTHPRERFRGFVSNLD